MAQQNKPESDSLDFDAIDLDDGMNFRKAPTGVKEIALTQLNRIMELGSKELHPSGTRRIIVNGDLQTIIVPDTAEQYYNSIDQLYFLLQSHLMNKAKELKKYIDEYEQREKEYFDFTVKNILLLNNLNRSNDKSYDPILERYNSDRMVKRKGVYQKKMILLSMLLAELKFFEESRGTF